MKLNKKILTFDWIVQIPMLELFLCLVFLPPLFFVWIFKVGQTAERKLVRKPNKIFRIMLLLFTLSFIVLILAISIESRIINIIESYIIYLFWILYISFLYCDYYITQRTFEVEDQDDEKYSSSVPDKFYRFLLLSLLLLGAVMLQPRIIEMFNNED